MNVPRKEIFSIDFLVSMSKVKVNCVSSSEVFSTQYVLTFFGIVTKSLHWLTLDRRLLGLKVKGKVLVIIAALSDQNLNYLFDNHQSWNSGCK